MLERLYGKDLRRLGSAWVKAANGVVWKLDLGDACQRWIVYGDYEGAAQMRWMRRWLDQGGVVIDSGANIGQIVLYLAPLPDVTIFAFEPVAPAADWLTECLQRYPKWEVEVIRQGLSSSPGTLTMQLDGPRSTLRSDWYQRQGFPTLRVPMTTLDDFFDEHQIQSVRLWKLDVEGHEMAALEGARRHLERQAIAAILIELSDVAGPQRLLKDCGYGLYRIERKGGIEPFVGGERPVGNLLALPERSLA